MEYATPPFNEFPSLVVPSLLWRPLIPPVKAGHVQLFRFSAKYW